MAVTIDGTNGITSPDFEPSSSTTPTNGLFLPTTNALGFATNSAERLRLDASGNLGLGVTPNTWSANNQAIEGPYGAVLLGTGVGTSLTANAYYNTGWKYKISGATARALVMDSSSFQWFTAPSGTAGNAISFTQAMTLDANGNLGIGTTSPTGAYRISLTGNGSSVVGGLALTSNGNTAYIGQVGAASADCEYWNAANGYVRIGTNNTERARIDSSGNFSVSGGEISSTKGWAKNVGGMGYALHTSGQVSTFTFTSSGVVVCIAHGGNGSCGVVFVDYLSSTVTILANPSNVLVASSSPTTSQIGVYKSAGSYTFSVKNGFSSTTNVGVSVNGSALSATTGPA